MTRQSISFSFISQENQDTTHQWLWLASLQGFSCTHPPPTPKNEAGSLQITILKCLKFVDYKLRFSMRRPCLVVMVGHCILLYFNLRSSRLP